MSSGGSKKSKIPPRKINVQKFAEARAPELESLHSIVANRLDSNFKSKRNKRRRTTAFDSQAAKKRFQKRRKLERSETLASEKDDEKKKIPRRIRRKIELKKNEEEGYCTSGDGTKRLRTHVWHAKRFTMTKLWGFHLPLGLQGRGRGSRAVLKWYKNGVVVHDASYYSAVQLEGTEGSLMSILRTVLVPSPSCLSDDIYSSILSGVLYGTAMLHHVGAPVSRPIGPVMYMWRPSFLHNGEKSGHDHDFDGCNEPQNSCSHRQLWMWVHAAAFSEAYGALKFACLKQMNESGILINCCSLEGQLAKLDIMGLKSFQLLQKTLHPVTCKYENSLQLKKCSVAEVDNETQLKKSFMFENVDNISSHSVLPLTVMDPRQVPEKRIADVPLSACTVTPSDGPEDESKEHVILPGISEKDKELLPPSSPNSEWKSGFTDSKNLWDASSRKSCPVEENILCSNKHHARMDAFCLDDPKTRMLQPSTMVQSPRSCPILLIKNNNQTCSFMGWSIILPLSWVRVFWIHCVSKGAHAIGLRERQWIACDVGLPHFPSDCPDCEAYLSFMAGQRAILDQKTELLPPAVRPFKVPIPPPWSSVHVAATLDTQASGRRDMVPGIPLPNTSSEDCDISSPVSNLFEGIVARTCGVLTDFLDKINGHHLLLFPQVSNGRMRIVQFMKDESKQLGHGQNGISQITPNHTLCFLRVLLHAYKEGVFEEGAIISAPSLNDVLFWTSRSEKNEGGLQIPESSVRSYFKEQFSGRWEVQEPKDHACRESHRWPIGFVTTGFVRGSKKPVAEGFCEAVLLARLREEQWNEMPVKCRRKEIYVLVRNMRSSAYRLALATIVLEQEEDDVEFL